MVQRSSRAVPVDREVFFDEREIIVSKTDTKGVITYANEVFIRVCGYDESELIGQPHNVIRHPDFPRGAFLLMWNIISEGREFFAYVKNIRKDGAYYWVLAHVTPSFDRSGRLTGYHSSRRLPEPAAVAEIDAVYDLMRVEEAAHTHAPEAARSGLALVSGILADKGVTYDEFVWDIINRHSPAVPKRKRAVLSG